MKKYAIIFICGLVIGSAGYWTVREGPLAAKVKENALVEKVGEKIQEREVTKVREEMEKNKRVVMNKPPGSTIPVLDDSRLTDLVRAKIAAEPTLAETEIRGEAKGGANVG